MPYKLSASIDALYACEPHLSQIEPFMVSTVSKVDFRLRLTGVSIRLSISTSC